MGTDILIPTTVPPESIVIGIKTIELTDAQIKALPTTPIQVVAAAGAGKYLKIFGGTFFINTTAGAYTNVEGTGNIVLGIGDLSGSPAASGRFVASDGLLENNSHGVIDFIQDGLPNSADVIDIENLPIQINSSNNTGDYTGGNAANITTVTVYYVVVEV